MGEGSSREHAAMEPRFRGARAVMARSFARIHETNLKKQGVLPLTFANSDDYDLIGPEDRISVVGLADLAPDTQVEVVITSPDGATTNIAMDHTYSVDQIEWFKAGSALNLIRQRT
jgi:aconitate hydratase